MKVKMLNNLLGVSKVGKSNKTDGLFADVETTQNLGIIRYLGEDVSEKFKVGQKVYFGNKREEIRMDSADIIVMEEDNIYAIVEEDSDGEDQK